MKLTVQLIERMNATRKLTMAINGIASQLARSKFKVAKKNEVSPCTAAMQKITNPSYMHGSFFATLCHAYMSL